eukprot:164590_1
MAPPVSFASGRENKIGREGYSYQFGGLFIFLCIAMLWCVYITINDTSKTYMYSNQSTETIVNSNSTVLNKQIYKDYDMVILVWTGVGGKHVIDWAEHRNLSTICNISTSNKMEHKILITPDKSLRKFANGLVFSVLDTSLRKIKKSHKRQNDVYVLETYESPVTLRRRWVPHFISNFNLLMSYSLKSDIPVPYGNFNIFKTWMNQQNKHSFTEKNNTSADVLWIGNNCHAKNGRQDYLRELFKYISVHSLGQCLHINPDNITIPPRSQLGKDISHIISKYKFYLSIENSQCEGYITEKLYKSVT